MFLYTIPFFAINGSWHRELILAHFFFIGFGKENFCCYSTESSSFILCLFSSQFHGCFLSTKTGGKFAKNTTNLGPRSNSTASSPTSCQNSERSSGPTETRFCRRPQNEEELGNFLGAPIFLKVLESSYPYRWRQSSVCERTFRYSFRQIFAT